MVLGSVENDKRPHREYWAVLRMIRGRRERERERVERKLTLIYLFYIITDIYMIDLITSVCLHLK